MNKYSVIRALRATLAGVAAVSFLACSSGVQVVEETYTPRFRQHAPDAVYSRLTWSHLPNPIPPRAEKKAPLLAPEISFEFPRSTLGEAVGALAQTIGYASRVPTSVGGRKISLVRVGTVEEILSELSQQARVRAEIDHTERVIVAYEGSVNPELPEIRSTGTL